MGPLGAASLRRRPAQHNLFGIKADETGTRREAVTTEYVEGVAQQRWNASAPMAHGEAMRDYASLLTSNPRYAGVLGATDAAAFARGLQRAGCHRSGLRGQLTRIIGGQALASAILA